MHSDFPTIDNTVRMTTTRLFKLTKTSSKSTRLEAVASMHLGGSFPASLNNFFTPDYRGIAGLARDLFYCNPRRRRV